MNASKRLKVRNPERETLVTCPSVYHCIMSAPAQRDQDKQSQGPRKDVVTPAEPVPLIRKGVLARVLVDPPKPLSALMASVLRDFWLFVFWGRGGGVPAAQDIKFERFKPVMLAALRSLLPQPAFTGVPVGTLPSLNPKPKTLFGLLGLIAGLLGLVGGLLGACWGLVGDLLGACWGLLGVPGGLVGGLRGLLGLVGAYCGL